MLAGITLEAFKRGLTDELAYAVTLGEPETLEDAMKIAQRIELMMKGKDQRATINVLNEESKPTADEIAGPSVAAITHDGESNRPKIWDRPKETGEQQKRLFNPNPKPNFRGNRYGGQNFGNYPYFPAYPPQMFMQPQWMGQYPLQFQQSWAPQGQSQPRENIYQQQGTQYQRNDQGHLNYPAAPRQDARKSEQRTEERPAQIRLLSAEHVLKNANGEENLPSSDYQHQN